jgi:flagellar protein FlbB
LLIVILLAGGLVWFDYLGVIDIKTTLAPVYRIPFVQRITGVDPRSQEPIDPSAFLNLDEERLAVRLEALSLRESEIDNLELDITSRQGEIEQMAAELEERQRSLDEREQSMNALSEAANSRDAAVTQTALYLNGMPPAAAVNILNEMGDQDAIEVLRKVEEIARAQGATSLVSFWFSQMPAARVAELQRKMASRP